MAEEHKIGDTVWAKDPVKRYLTHAGKITKIAPGFITIKKLSGVETKHPTADVSKDFSKLNPNPYKKRSDLDESFSVKSPSGKVISTHFSESDALRKKEELDKKTGQTHTVQYSREATVKEESEEITESHAGDLSINMKHMDKWKVDQDNVKFYDAIMKSKGKISTLDVRPYKEHLNAFNIFYTQKGGKLDEISQSTVDSYKEKATDELKQAKKYTKSEYGDIAKRIIQRRKKGLKMADTRTESVEESGGGSHLTQNLPGKATHITKKDIRHSDGGIVAGSTTLRNVEGDKYEIRSGRYKGKIATFHPDNLQKLEEGKITDTIKKTVKKIGRSVSGWHPDSVGPNGEELGNPKDIVNRVKQRSDDDLKRLSRSLKTPLGFPFGTKAPDYTKGIAKHSPAGLQAKATEREMKKRGLAEDLDSIQEAKEIKVGSIVKPKIGPHAGQEHEVIHIHDDGTFNIKPHKMDVKKIRYRLGAVRCTKEQLQEDVNESSLEDLVTGKGDGKELKSSPDYKRDRRRLMQVMAARRERDARVKRGYKEDDKDLDEAKLAMPLKGHAYHTKTDDELRFIVKDAGEAAKAMKGHSPKSEAKYLDQVNDASTVLHYRSKGGQRQVKESESLDEMGYGQDRRAEHEWSNSGSSMSPKAHKYHVKNRNTGKIVSTHGNAPDAVKARKAVGDASTHAIVKEDTLDELSKDTLNSYVDKAKQSAEKLSKQGDSAKKIETKYSKYVKSAKRYKNIGKAKTKIFFKNDLE